MANFLDVPAEIRIDIYNRVLLRARRNPIMVHHRRHRPRVPGILHASRKVRAETLPLFYNYITLLLKQDPDTALALEGWLHAVGRGAVSELRHLRIECYCYNRDSLLGTQKVTFVVNLDARQTTTETFQSTSGPLELYLNNRSSMIRDHMERIAGRADKPAVSRDDILAIYMIAQGSNQVKPSVEI